MNAPLTTTTHTHAHKRLPRRPWVQPGRLVASGAMDHSVQPHDSCAMPPAPRLPAYRPPHPPRLPSPAPPPPRCRCGMYRHGPRSHRHRRHGGGGGSGGGKGAVSSTAAQHVAPRTNERLLLPHLIKGDDSLMKDVHEVRGARQPACSASRQGLPAGRGSRTASCGSTTCTCHQAVVGSSIGAAGCSGVWAPTRHACCL